MKIGDLKPKGSDKTLNEWMKICLETWCEFCNCRDECDSVFKKISPNKLVDLTDIEVED